MPTNTQLLLPAAFIESLVTDKQVKFDQDQPIIDVRLRKVSAFQGCPCYLLSDPASAYVAVIPGL